MTRRGAPTKRCRSHLLAFPRAGDGGAGRRYRVGRAQSRSLARTQAVFRAGCRGRAVFAIFPHSGLGAAGAARRRTEVHLPRSYSDGQAAESRRYATTPRCMATNHLLPAVWPRPGRLYYVGTHCRETKMSSDSSTPRVVWPWGKPLPRFESPEEEETFWETHEVEGPPADVGEVVVSKQSRWIRRDRPLSLAGWAGLGGAVGAVLGSYFGIVGAGIGGCLGAGLIAYVRALRSPHEQRSP